MKTKIKIVALFLLLFAATFTAPQKASAQGIAISFQVFYDELSPYGNWVFNPEYGYVWMPNVAPGFFPYASDGYWVFTDIGWTWVSFYPWGWAPFHYGRWFIDPFYGPMWVPGYEWGPGWVVWRSSGECYGWAPMGPGISIALAYSRDYFVPYNYWRFVNNRDFGRPYIYNYYVDNSVNITIINNSTVINNVREDRSSNVTYNAGPDRHEVEKLAGRSVTPVIIKESAKPVQDLKNNELALYRPTVQKTDAIAHKAAPSKVVKLDNMKPAAYKTAEVSQQKGVQPANQKQVQPKAPVQPGKSAPAKSQQYGNPSGKTEAVKQPQQGKTSSKAEAVKPPQHDNTSGKTDVAKPPQQRNPSGKTDAVKQSQQGNPPKKSEGGKQPQHGNHPKTGKKV